MGLKLKLVASSALDWWLCNKRAAQGSKASRKVIGSDRSTKRFDMKHRYVRHVTLGCRRKKKVESYLFPRLDTTDHRGNSLEDGSTTY